MEKTSRTKQSQILVSFIPLVLFIAAEIFLPTKQAAMVAIISGITTIPIVRILSGIWDRFLIYDTLILILLGSASVVYETEEFIRFKPAITQSLLIIYLGIPLFSDRRKFTEFIHRSTLGLVKVNAEQIPILRKHFLSMFFMFFIHTLLLYYGGFFWSTTVCTSVSIAGLGLIPIATILLSRLSNLFQFWHAEFVPLIDEQGKVLGKISRNMVHNGNKMLHPVVHCHIVNPSGQIFLQQRSWKANIQPGKWDSAVGGHVRWGETIEKALLREMKEETSLTPTNLIPLKHYIWESEIEKEFVFSFVEISTAKPKINPKEAENGRWWTLAQIKSQPKEMFTPNLLHELNMLESAKILKN